MVCPLSPDGSGITKGAAGASGVGMSSEVVTGSEEDVAVVAASVRFAGGVVVVV